MVSLPASRDSEPLRKRQRPSENEKRTRRYDEIASIQDAQVEGDSLGSVAIRTALDHFLASRRLSESLKDSIGLVLREAKASIDSLPQKSLTFAVKSAVTREILSKVAPHLSAKAVFRSPQCTELAIQCEPPSNINVVGSFLLGYTSSAVADIAVEMPSSILKHKDFINYKYHDKRLLYLLYLAHHFSQMKEQKWLRFSITEYPLAGNIDHPSLTVSHTDFPQIRVRILPTYAANVFDAERLGDDRRNVRPAGESSVVQQESHATVKYNQAILADARFITYLKTLHAISTSCPNFVDCVLLLEAWSIRHRLLPSKFLFAVLISDLISRSIVPRSASREHLLRCAFNAMRSRCLESLSLHGVRVSALVDLALLDRISECSATALRIIESESASDDPWNGVLSHLFASARGTQAKHHPLSTLFDGFLRLYGPEDMSLTFDVREKVFSVLHTALVKTKRVSQIETLSETLFGLTFESHEAVVRKVDVRGESDDADQFKSFWKSKASLRRFRDGKIVEALVWSGGVQTLNEIATYAINTHFGETISCRVFTGLLETAANMPSSNDVQNRAILSFNELATQLRSVDLPLKIHSVHATSPQLRRCGMYAIRPNPGNIFIEPLEIVATFESSHAWPTDAVALAASKAAFYVALKNKLAEKGIASQATISHIDIIVGEFFFRLRAWVETEEKVLEGSPEINKFRWETKTVVQHHDDFRSVENVILVQVCQLAKRWLNAHMMFKCLGKRREEIVELLVISAVRNGFMKEVKSTMLGFCRFLHLLAEFPWEVCPLVVSFSEADEGAEETFESDRSVALRKAQKHFAEKGKTFGLYVSHGEDILPIIEQSEALERVIISRIQAISEAALQFIDQFLSKPDSDSNLNTLFIADTDGFDVELKFSERACVMGKLSAKDNLVNRKGERKIKHLVPGFDPMERVWHTLEERLSRWALFLGQLRSGSSLYLVWRPAVKKTVKFSLRESAYCEPKNGKLTTSTDELLQEIALLSNGLLVEARKIEPQT